MTELAEGNKVPETDTGVETVEAVQSDDGSALAAVDATVDDGGDLVVTIGEEAPPADEEVRAPEWVRELRKSHRDIAKENRELKAALAERTTETKPVALGEKPKHSDFDYDDAAYEAALDSWYDAKRQADAAADKAREAQKAERDAWDARLATYNKAKAELRVSDFEDAESHVLETLSVTQQGVVLQGADKPELVIYALGKNPAKVAELAAIKDPVKFAFAVAKLEAQLKVGNRKAPPAPERVLSSQAPAGGNVDKKLDELRAIAARTGNLQPVLEYRRKLAEANSS
jgi:hypothetical protein